MIKAAKKNLIKNFCLKERKKRRNERNQQECYELVYINTQENCLSLDQEANTVGSPSKKSMNYVNLLQACRG